AVNANAIETYGSTEAIDILGSPIKCNRVNAMIDTGVVTQTGIQRDSLPISRCRKMYSSTNGPSSPITTIEMTSEDSPAACSTASWFAETSGSCPDNISSADVSIRVANQITGSSKTFTHHQLANQRKDCTKGRHDTSSMMIPVMP